MDSLDRGLVGGGEGGAAVKGMVTATRRWRQVRRQQQRIPPHFFEPLYLHLANLNFDGSVYSPSFGLVGVRF